MISKEGLSGEEDVEQAVMICYDGLVLYDIPDSSRFCLQTSAAVETSVAEVCDRWEISSASVTHNKEAEVKTAADLIRYS
jgi:hypothetical protein